MPQVAVQIAGKTYRMACDEGQEPHLMELARRFDASIEQLRGSFGEIGDQRLTVMAGVMVTDEVVELTRQVAGLKEEVARLRAGARTKGGDDAALREEKVAAALARTAQKIDAIAKRLENA